MSLQLFSLILSQTFNFLCLSISSTLVDINFHYIRVRLQKKIISNIFINLFNMLVVYYYYMNKKINIALIGAGRAGYLHCNSLNESNLFNLISMIM